MSRIDDIEALLLRAENKLPEIKKKYDDSLSAQNIPVDLKIDIKDYFGNLRSILDYIAHDIVEKYCPTASPSNRLYFPITPDQAQFDGTMTRSYPGLDISAPSAYLILEEAQPFKRDANRWLSFFNKLNNEHKHDRLVPQTRSETKRVDVQTQGGGNVSWNAGAVTFGSGVFIGGVPIDPQTQMPVPSPTQTVTVQIWVDYQFESIPVSAIWLTEESLVKTRQLFLSLKPSL